MRRALAWIAGLGAVLGLARAAGADSFVEVDPEARHEYAARAATMAWWLGVQEYPHGELEGLDSDDTRPIEAVNRRSVAAIARALDTMGEGQVFVVFNPLGFRNRSVVRQSMVAHGGTSVALAVDLPAIGAGVYELPPLAADSSRVERGHEDVAPTSPDSIVAAGRERARHGRWQTVVPVDDPAEGPWGRSLSFLQLGTTQGPGHPRVDIERLYKHPRADRVVVRLVNRSDEPASRVIVAPIAPIRAWQELGPDDGQIVAGDDVDLQGGALICNVSARARRAFALELAPPPPYRALRPDAP